MRTHREAHRRSENDKTLALRASAKETSARTMLALAVLVFFGCAQQPTAKSPPASDDAAETAASVEEEDEIRAAPLEEPVESVAAALVPESAEDEPQPAPLLDDSEEANARQPDGGPQPRTAFYRADAATPAAIPKVTLSEAHEALCRVKVGDTMPAIELEQIGGERRRLADLAGEKATVVVFWKSDRHMARQELIDLGPDVLEPYGDAGVSVVGIAVRESLDGAENALQSAEATFPNLLDSNGDAFGQVGSEKLPRTYLLDPQGKILWFDIEYSLATRHELHQALRAVTGGE